jgi:hypothetical protein
MTPVAENRLNTPGQLLQTRKRSGGLSSMIFYEETNKNACILLNEPEMRALSIWYPPLTALPPQCTLVWMLEFD